MSNSTACLRVWLCVWGGGLGAAAAGDLKEEEVKDK